MNRTPRKLLKLLETPFVKSGAAQDVVEKARRCFDRHDMRGYANALWDVRRAGAAAVASLREQALANTTPPSAEDLAKAEKYATLTGRRRKSFGHRHRAALQRAGVRCDASVQNAAADEAIASVWGL